MTVHTFTLDPFDMLIHTTSEGVSRLQSRFASWLRGLSGPARFLCWQVPADLDERIGQVARTAQTAVPPRSSLLMAYRRGYERLQRGSSYQRTTCGLMQWAADNPGALAGTLASAFDVRVIPGPLPALFQGQYVLRDRPLWHLAPIERPGGRPVWGT